MNGYTTEQLRASQIDEQIFKFLRCSAEVVSLVYDSKLDWKNFPLRYYADHHRLILCRRDQEPVGVMLSRLFPSVLDPKIKILYQDSLFVVPGTRAAKILMDDFLTFGKANADHLITCIGSQTRIKGASLQKLGFTKLEELYRFEVKR